MASATLTLKLAPRSTNPFPHDHSKYKKPNATFSECEMATQKSTSKSMANCAETRYGHTVVKDQDQHQPRANTCAYLLQACTNMEFLKQTHACVFKNAMHQDPFLATKLVSLYASFGGIEDARYVFDEMPQRNVFPWNVMIREYARIGFYGEVLTLYYQMQGENVWPDNLTFPFVLKACSVLKALKVGKEVHGHVIRREFEGDVYVGTAILDMYAKCGNVGVLPYLFDKMPERNLVSWNAIIAGLSQNGNNEDAVRIFIQMQMEGVKPDLISVVSVLPSLADLQQVKWIHGCAVKCGFISNVTVGNALVAIYARWSDIKDARQVFNKMPKRDVVSWNSMIYGCVESGYAEEALRLFNQMHMEDVRPAPVTIVNIMSACTREYGKCIHGYIIKSGFEAYIPVQNSLITMYAKHGTVDDAFFVFDNLDERSVISWNAMSSGYAQNRFACEVIMLFIEMHLANFLPDSVTIISVLQACAILADPKQVRWIHGYVIRNGFDLDTSVGNSLISSYTKSNSVKAAHQAFDKMPTKNVVSYNALIAGYAQNGLVNEALTLYKQMRFEDLIPDSGTMVSVLQACSQLAELGQGKLIHGFIVKSGFDSGITVENALVSMYSKCGRVEFASQVFGEMSERDLVSWNAMIAGYAQSECANEALIIFQEMIFANMKPNSITIVNVLQACSILAALQQGKWIHGYIIRNGFMSDVSVGNGLIDMYAKCGSLDVSRWLFNNMSTKDVVSWSAMIIAYGMHGYGKNALATFWQMQQANIKPNDVTFVCVLSACSHAGLLDEGLRCFDSMIRDYGITPRIEHYTCVVDLLGRAGYLDKAHNFIEKMPLKPAAQVWGALLGACRIHCNLELGKLAAEHIFNLEPYKEGSYILLSNIYAAAGRWQDAAKVRSRMNGIGLKKQPGCSWIEINNKVHSFIVGDKSHPQTEKIYALLETLELQMLEIGYVPNTHFVLHDVEEEVKEQMLFRHSEKLAIAFGLINSRPGTLIRITKNLRVCGDCHTATKLISKIVKREIIMRDLNRFHHFKDGLCSCGDYW